MSDLGPRGLQALSDIIEDKKHPRHEQAAEYVVNRWKGTPTARHEVTTPPGQPIGVVADVKRTEPTSDEKRRELAALVKKGLAAAAAAMAAGGGAAGGAPAADPDED